MFANKIYTLKTYLQKTIPCFFQLLEPLQSHQDEHQLQPIKSRSLSTTVAIFIDAIIVSSSYSIDVVVVNLGYMQPDRFMI